MIYTSLSHGHANAITGQALASMLGKDIRTVVVEIEREPRAGLPICASSSGGYYLAETPWELERYQKSLNRRVRNYTETLSAITDTLCRMIGQEQMQL